MNNAKIGAAVVGGYVLGRTKKAKLALSIGAALAGSRVRPGQLGKALDTSFLSGIRKQVRTELTEASKAAATSVLTAKAESLAETLHERTAGLQEKAHLGGEKDEGESGREDEPRAEEEREDEEERDEEPRAEEEREDEEDRDEEPLAEEEREDEEERDEEDRAKGRENEGREAEGRHKERKGEERQSRARRAPARRGEGREKAQHRGSDEGSEPRKRKAAAAQSRPKSGTSGSRRQDDG